MEPAVEETKDNSTRLHYRSAALGRFFAEHCGNGSRSKHIPELLWTLPEPYFLAFLEGYSDGDGYTSAEGKLIVTSASQRLIRELAWLCSMHGIKGGVRHGMQEGGRVIRAKELPDGEYWSLIIGKTSNPFAGGMPTHEHKKPVIRKITRVPYDGYVYDLCGCDNEAFFGGEKPVLLHNSRVRDLFEQAKQNSPCIIFMDEIDAVGRQRGAGMGGGHDEREQTLNQLLVEMDGFDSQSGIIMLAATNRPDILDPALLRPGRFDRQIVVDRPDYPGRERILRVHSRGKPLGDDIDISVVAKGTPGFTGADLANLINEAALLAARHDKEVIEQAEMDEAVDRVIAGPERKTRLISDKEKEITAFHEAGHAIVGALLEHADPVHKISIIPRGQALGVTMSLPEEDRFMMSRSEMMDQLSMMLGGRAAESVIFDEITTGASNDIERVTKMARAMVTRYGMSEKLGLIALGNSEAQVFMGRDFNNSPDYSDEIAFQIDREIRRIVDESYDSAEDLLMRNRDLLDKLSADLIEYETVDAPHLKRLIEEHAVDKPNFEPWKPHRNGHEE
jgi:ATP-dependent metalloprotease FtsH